MRAKFKRGDPTRFTPRATKYAIEGLRKRTRTVATVYYDSDDQCVYYTLGGWGKAKLDFSFRSYMLRLVTRKEQGKIGKPRQKRKYHLRSKLPRSLCNPNLGGHTPIPVALYPEPPDFELRGFPPTKTQGDKITITKCKDAESYRAIDKGGMPQPILHPAVFNSERRG